MLTRFNSENLSRLSLSLEKANREVVLRIELFDQMKPLSYGNYISPLADATRTELDFLKEVYIKAVREGGADEVVIVDTLGVATPETMYFLTKKVKEWVDVPVMTHCHNDFGLGVACTLSSVKAGEEYAQVTVNGLGEKTGNADLAKVAIAAHYLSDVILRGVFNFELCQ